jgi:RecA/RadA recombinase
MPVVDITVEGEKYMAHGILHHNTTPGGNAVPYHSSVRIKVNASKKIEDPATKDTIGVTVSSNIIKNKVGFPHRKSMFEIHFGIGIVEDEYLFDAIRRDEPVVVDEDGNTVEISGTAAWKYFFVRDKDGKEILERKFRKKAESNDTSFIDLMRDPDYRPWIDKYIEKVLTKKPNASNRLLSLTPEEIEEYKRGVVDPD